MRYYTLAVKVGNAYFPEFGDYDKDVVIQERQDLIESGERASLRIVASNDDQSSINQAISNLNGSL